jgi:hypothetical protein
MKKTLAFLISATLALLLPLQAVPQCVVPANGAVVKTAGFSPLAADTGKLFVMNCSTACTVTLPATPQSPVWMVLVESIGAGAVTISPNGLNLNGSASSLVMPVAVGTTFQVWTDNSNYFAIGAATTTIASGASAMGTSAISSATCASVVTATATGVLATDAIVVSFNADPQAVTGYVPLTTGMLTIIAYPTAGNVNFLVCNNTSASITPGAVTLNWRVAR